MRTYMVTSATNCRGKDCRKLFTTRPNTREVDLTPALNGARLPIGTVLTVTFRKPLTIGQVVTLSIGAAGPTSRDACIPVGQTRAATRCRAS
jgi:hypothetical protein